MTPGLVALFLAIPLAVAVGAALVARSLLSSRAACSNELRSERVAPGGAHRVVVYVRACGASEPASTNVSVVPTGKDLPDAGGNVMVLEGELPVGTEWRDARALVISLRRGQPISRLSEEVYGVRASVEEL